MLAKQVRHARNTSRIFVNRFNSLGSKDGSSIGAANSQALRNVPSQFLKGQRLRSAAHGDALTQLPQTRIAQLLLKFGLPRKHDLQQFLVGGLEIRQQADFLQYLKGQVLRFVHNENGGLSVAVPLQQPVVQAHEHMAFVPALARNPKIRHHEVEQLTYIQLGIEDVSGRNPFQIEPIEQTVEQRRLTRANLAGHQDKTLSILYPVGQTCQRFLNLPREKQITRIRVGIERIFSQPKERFIHELVSSAGHESRPVRVILGA